MYVRGYLQGSENGRVVTIAVEIKIKWMIRKHMTYENTYRDDTCTLLSDYLNIF